MADCIVISNGQIKPVQKQTRAGQRTRFKAIVVIGDSEGHVGLGIKTSKEVATAIRAAIIIAKLSVLPIRRGYWGTSLGDPHSLPTKESGKCGSVTVRVSRTYLYIQAAEKHDSLIIGLCTAHPRPSRNRSRRLASRETSPSARWCSRCLHFLCWLYQDAREHAKSYVRCGGQYLRFPDPESVEGE